MRNDNPFGFQSIRFVGFGIADGDDAIVEANIIEFNLFVSRVANDKGWIFDLSVFEIVLGCVNLNNVLDNVFDLADISQGLRFFGDKVFFGLLNGGLNPFFEIVGNGRFGSRVGFGQSRDKGKIGGYKQGEGEDEKSLFLHKRLFVISDFALSVHRIERLGGFLPLFGIDGNFDQVGAFDKFYLLGKMAHTIGNYKVFGFVSDDGDVSLRQGFSFKGKVVF